MASNLTKRQKKLSRHRIWNRDVAEVFNSYPRNVKPKIRRLRTLIIDTAEKISGVGELEETLKWGEPSYITSESKAGSTIRLDWKSRDPQYVAIYFKCTTDLVAAFKKRFKWELTFEGNRAILLRLDEDFPKRELQLCVALALTYHLNRKLPAESRWKFINEALGT